MLTDEHNSTRPDMMSEKMFWDLVKLVNWPKLCRTGRGAHEQGKKILLGHLPDREMAYAYEAHLCQKTGYLAHAIESWEEEEGKKLPVSDDGFSDLLNHIVGCGFEEWKRTCEDPSLAMKRAENYDYVESFSYCTPHSSDYDSDEVKHQRALRGLEHWMEKAALDPGYKTAKDEVEWRSREVAELELKIYGKEINTERVEAKVKELRLNHLKSAIQEHKSKIKELEAEVAKIEAS